MSVCQYECGCVSVWVCVCVCVRDVSSFVSLQVTYYPFLEAMSLAKNQLKLVHMIMLWGALDDQSC